MHGGNLASHGGGGMKNSLSIDPCKFHDLKVLDMFYLSASLGEAELAAHNLITEKATHEKIPLLTVFVLVGRSLINRAYEPVECSNIMPKELLKQYVASNGQVTASPNVSFFVECAWQRSTPPDLTVWRTGTFLPVQNRSNIPDRSSPMQRNDGEFSSLELVESVAFTFDRRVLGSIGVRVASQAREYYLLPRDDFRTPHHIKTPAAEKYVPK
jgi:hypothetical protein